MTSVNQEKVMKFRSLQLKKDYSMQIIEEVLFPEHLIENTKKDINLENFHYNILVQSDPLEKKRIVWLMLEKNGFINELVIPLQIFCEFVNIIKKKYNKRKNPFHNFDHGVSGNKLKKNNFFIGF